MKRSFKGFLLLCLVTAIFSTFFLRGADNIVVQLRLYEGFKKKGKVSAVVVSSYYLKKLAKEHILSDMQIEKEKKSLEKIYNLEDVENISIIDMALKKGGENTQEIVLGGRKLAITLSMFPKSNNRFKVEVREKGKKAALMETEVFIPQEKTAVLGFEDATNRIFFFSFHREKDISGGKESRRVASLQFPRLIKRVVPVYPEKVLAEGVEGDVLVRAVIDESGSVTQLRIEEGVHPLLDEAALNAVKQWKYKPWVVNGVPKSTEVVVKIFFKIKEHSEKTDGVRNL